MFIICAIFFLFFGNTLYPMNQEDDGWNLKRYFETKELTRWSTTTYEEAEDYASTGKRIWDELMKNQYKGSEGTIFNEKQELVNQKEELIKRVAVCWYLYSEALEQKKPFYNGTFVIKDTYNHNVYNFFYDYVNNTIDEAHKKPVYYSNNPFSYARHSTHFKNDKEEDSEYGIDVRYSKDAWCSYDLPSGCCHILFAKLNENKEGCHRMFLKMEDAGLYVAEFPYHVGGVIGSCARKFLPYIFGEGIASKLITLNNEKFCQKEHFPNHICTMYYKICKKQNIEPRKVSTIAQVWNHILSLKDNENLFQEIIECINNNYSDPSERFGNEIIINKNGESIN